MQMRKSEAVQAALWSCAITFVALYPFWYGVLMEYAHFPELPVALFFVYLLGAPGAAAVYVMDFFSGNQLWSLRWGKLNIVDARIVIAILSNLILYFVLFRAYFYFKARP